MLLMYQINDNPLIKFEIFRGKSQQTSDKHKCIILMQIYLITPWWIYRKYFKSIKKKKRQLFLLILVSNICWYWYKDWTTNQVLKSEKKNHGYPGVLGLRISGLD